MKSRLLVSAVILVAAFTGILFYRAGVSRAGQDDSALVAVERLQQVLYNQQEILKKLDNIRMELDRIRVRAR